MEEGYPRRFGKYTLVAPLAQGGMGALHLAFTGPPELRKLCVIKTILSHLADQEFTNRFLDEAKVMVQLSHGNLVPVLEAGQVEGEFFLAMEHIDGKDLRAVWRRLADDGRTFPLDVALYVVREICRGLGYVHTFADLRLVHRDVSPPNVLLSYTGEVRLTDFGVATSTIKLQKTAPGILMGKLSYMSPEQARNQRVDARADLYSLGVILWEMLTGRQLIPAGDNQIEQYQRTLDPQLDPPSKYNPQVQPELDLVTLRALAPERSKRFADAEELRQALSQVLGILSPAIDASVVQTLLEELFGDQRADEERQRRELVDSAVTHVQDLVGAGGGEETPEGVKPEPTEAAVAEEAGDVNGSMSPTLPQGKVIGERYRVEELIGEGGMGRVYLATHVEIDKLVALKVLHPTYGRMPELVTRFRQEARAASRIGHPHIVEVYDSGKTEAGAFYFVMEHLVGVDLAEVLAGERTLEVDRGLHIVVQICEALAAAHKAGVVHRDLKPENIFLTSAEGTPDFVKVLDFGLARGAGLGVKQDAHLTRPGTAMGTPEYMAPEQGQGEPSDHRADIYSVGVIFYEMLVGVTPHADDVVMEVFRRKSTEPVTPPRRARREIPAELERVILWTLERDAEDRPQSMAQLAYELKKLSRGRAGAVADLLGISAQDLPPAGAEEPAEPPQSKADPETGEVSTPPPRGDPAGRGRWLLTGAGLVLAGLLMVWLVLDSGEGGQGERAPAVVSDTVKAGPLSGAGRRDARAVAPLPRDSSTDARGAAADAGVVATPPRPVAPSLLVQGRRHLKAGRFGAARAAFLAALRGKKGRGKAALGLAEVEFQLGRFSEARRRAAEAATLGGGWKAHLVLANAHFRLGDYREAARLYEAVLATQGDHPEARRNLEAARRRLGQ
jgi:serine/threonine protein kinase